MNTSTAFSSHSHLVIELAILIRMGVDGRSGGVGIAVAKIGIAVAVTAGTVGLAGPSMVP